MILKTNIVKREIKGEYPSYLCIDKNTVSEVKWVDSKADATKFKDLATATAVKNTFSLITYRSDQTSNVSFKLVEPEVYVVERFKPENHYRYFLQTYVKASRECSLMWTTELCDAKQFYSLESASKACDVVVALFEIETTALLRVLEIDKSPF